MTTKKIDLFEDWQQFGQVKVIGYTFRNGTDVVSLRFDSGIPNAGTLERMALLLQEHYAITAVLYEDPTPRKYTVFCQQKDAQGTIHIEAIEARDLESAKMKGRESCLADWTAGNPDAMKLEDIHCLGVFEGDCDVLHWEDQYE